jgi:hypothetical protein
MTFIKYYFLSFATFVFIACGQIEPTESAKSIDSIQIANEKDTLPRNLYIFISLNPNKLSPASFLNSVIDNNNNDTLFKVITLEVEFPCDWVTISDIDTLMRLITSKKACYCYYNLLSSHIPVHEKADIGGYSIILINSFRQKTKIDLGSFNCPKTEKNAVEELNKWWTQYKDTQ